MAKPLDLMNDDLLYLGGRGSQKWRLTGELISHPTVELIGQRKLAKRTIRVK